MRNKDSWWGMVDGVWTSGFLRNVVSPVLTFSTASCPVAVTDGYISKAPARGRTFMDRSFLAAASLITPPIDVCKGNKLHTSATNKQHPCFFVHPVLTLIQNVFLFLAKVWISSISKNIGLKSPQCCDIMFWVLHISWSTNTIIIIKC